jgi:hypothetical protein
MAFDTDNKVTIISGTTSAEIATTYLASANAHYQNVMIVDQTGNVKFGEDPFPMVLTNSSGIPLDTSGGNLSVELAGSSTVNSIIVGQSLDTVIVAGKAGATAIAITAGNFQIRGLSAAIDSISVYGVQGATAVGITAGNFQIRGLTAETDSIAVKGISGGLAVNMLVHGISGATQTAIGVSADALKVFMTNSLAIDGNVTIDASDLSIRSLSFGTFNDAVPGASYDGVRVAGFSGAYPVAMALYGISGNSWTPVGVTGSKLQVDIGQLTLTGGTFNIDMSNVSVTNVVNIKGSSSASAPLWISGTTGAGGALAVTGAGVSGSIRIEGFSAGSPIAITASNLQIRGLTYTSTTRDWVGISGDVAEDVDAISKVVGNTTDSTSTSSIFGKISSVASDISSVKTAVGTDGTAIQVMLKNAINNPDTTGSASLKVQIDSIKNGLSTANTIPVAVQSMAQPNAVSSGQLSVTTNPSILANIVTKSGVTIKALAANTIPIYVGPVGVAVGTGYELSPGEAVFLEVNNTNLVGVVALATGATACYLVS